MHSRLLPSTIILATLLCAGPAHAAEPTSATDRDEAGMMEEAREGLRWGSEWLARGVDSWFGDVPFEDGGKVSDGRLRMSLFTRQGDSPRFSLRFNARFRLPNVERRAYLFIGRDNPREVVVDRPDAFSRNQQLLPDRAEDRRFFAGIGLDLRDSLDFRLGFRGGLKPYAQVRWQRPWQLDAVTRAEARETLFVTIDDHLGSTTALSIDRAMSPVLAVRALASGTVTHATGTLEWSGLLGTYRAFGHDRVLSLEGVIGGRLDRGGASDYGLRARWEQPLYKDWLIGEVLVGHFWPREETTRERRRAWALGGQLKVMF